MPFTAIRDIKALEQVHIELIYIMAIYKMLSTEHIKELSMMHFCILEAKGTKHPYAEALKPPAVN